MSTKDNDTVSLTVIAAEPQITLPKALRVEIKKIAQRVIDREDTVADHRRFRAIAKEVGCTIHALGSVLGMRNVFVTRRRRRGLPQDSPWPVTVSLEQLEATWGEAPLHMPVLRGPRKKRTKRAWAKPRDATKPRDVVKPSVPAKSAPQGVCATLALPGQKEPFVLVIKDVTSLDLLDRLVRSYL